MVDLNYEQQLQLFMFMSHKKNTSDMENTEEKIHLKQAFFSHTCSCLFINRTN